MELLHGHGAVVEDELEAAVVGVVEEVFNGDGVIGAVGLNDEVVSVFFHQQPGGLRALEDQSVDGAAGLVGDGVVAVSGGENIGVGTVTAGKGVVTCAAVEGVIPLLAVEAVVTVTAVQQVVAVLAVQAVITAVAVKEFMIIPAGKIVGGISSINI